MIPVLVFYLVFPAAIIWACIRYPVLDKIGMIILCYGAGLILGNSGVLPPGISGIQEQVCEATVALSLPLLLFSLDLKQWVHLAGKTILSMGLATLSIILVSATGLLFLSGPDNWKLMGMAVGVYTGGTPNLAAIKTALDVDPELFLTFHTYDIFISMLCVVFFITIAQRVCLSFLPRFTRLESEGTLQDHGEDIDQYKGMMTPASLKAFGAALLLSGLIVGGSLGISSFLPKSQATAATILSITTLGIAGSFVPRIRQIPKSFQLGMYLIMIFCLTVSSMSSLERLVNLNLPLLGYVTLCVFGSLSLHALLCRMFRIDTDTFIITSASAICSPPFVPVVAAALKNKTIIISGLTTGIIGYAIGNYLGISMAYIVHTFIQ
ncbi:MAG TPA: hypothetical protein DHV36_08815 [Desulfobacteraceae bacterium]|nr:hypothetical protein [Desulfobacteraceae bacterium]|tara:strand:- start:283 stop:1422 length:1140 start_codon:yes stop_codon:yes gene_type:complete